MAKFLEYRGKEFFKEAAIPVPEGVVVKTPEDAEEAARKIGKPVVVKAQVLAGGRGKAGGVKLAATPEEAKAGCLADPWYGNQRTAGKAGTCRGAAGNQAGVLRRVSSLIRHRK